MSTAYPVTAEQQVVLDELDFSDLTYRIGSGQLTGQDLDEAVSLYTLYLFSRDDPGIEEWRRIFLTDTQGMSEAEVVEYLIDQCQELVRAGSVTPSNEVGQ